MSLAVEGSQPAVPSIGDAQPRSDATEQVVHGAPAVRPLRRRRSALVGGGALVAASPVAVGAGVFAVGFAALGLGALLLLLPPRTRQAPRRRSTRRVVGATASAGGRGAAALARGGVHAFGTLQRFTANEGRDGAVRLGRASVDSALTFGRAASAVAFRAWSAVQVIALGVWRGLVAAARWLAREARRISIRGWERGGPMLGRAWAACLAGSRRAGLELVALAHSASARLSGLRDSHALPPPRAPRTPPRGAARPVRRVPAVPRPRSRVRSARSRRSPPSSG